MPLVQAPHDVVWMSRQPCWRLGTPALILPLPALPAPPCPAPTHLGDGVGGVGLSPSAQPSKLPQSLPPPTLEAA